MDLFYLVDRVLDEIELAKQAAGRANESIDTDDTYNMPVAIPEFDVNIGCLIVLFDHLFVSLFLFFFLFAFYCIFDLFCLNVFTLRMKSFVDILFFFINYNSLESAFVLVTTSETCPVDFLRQNNLKQSHIYAFLNLKRDPSRE